MVPLTMESTMRKEVVRLSELLVRKLKAIQVKVTLRDHRNGVSAKLMKR